MFKLNISTFPANVLIHLHPMKHILSLVSHIRWMDGAFLELESESIEGEADDFWRDIYKINKGFTNSKKKADAEKAMNAPKKKKKMGDEEAGEAEEEQEEDTGWAALKVCSTVMEQCKEFKVRGHNMFNVRLCNVTL